MLDEKMSKLECFSPKITADGSYTFFSAEFGESFHSHFGARQESFLKFAVPTNLAVQAHKPHLRILDICYGLGYNTAAALETIWQTNPSCNVEIIALELDLSVPQAAIGYNLFATNWLSKITEVITQISENQTAKLTNLSANLLIGDARKTIQQAIASGFQADAIFLDPFSPPHCPQLWSLEFIQLVTQCLSPEGFLATYSCAASVRMAMLNAGLVIGSTPPVGRKTPGTIAAFPTIKKPSQWECESIYQPNYTYQPNNTMISQSQLFAPPIPENYALTPSEIEHLATRAAVPYRDPHLCDSATTIIHRRQQEQANSHLEPTSHWRKRWQTR